MRRHEASSTRSRCHLHREAPTCIAPIVGVMQTDEMKKKRPKPKTLGSEERFYQRYGRAMAEWSTIEYALSTWFQQLAEMTLPISRAVFRSHNSFRASLKMLEIALDGKPRDKLLTEFFNEALTRVRAYYEFRNILAHDLSIWHATDKEMRLMKHVSDYFDEGVTSAELTAAGRNFKRLSQILMFTLPVGKPMYTPEQGFKRLRQLPANARKAATSRKKKSRTIA